jgi:NTE family protein
MLEMRRVNFVQKLLEHGLNLDNRFKDLRIHNINPEKDLAQFNTSSKLNANWDFLLWLHKLGKQYGNEWLNKNYDRIGVESTCDVQEVFL